MNATMAPEVQTVFLPASPAVRAITATLVRQIAAMGGDISPFVPATVAARLKAKLAGLKPLVSIHRELKMIRMLVLGAVLSGRARAGAAASRPAPTRRTRF